MSRYRFALRPRWIISHLFVGAMVILMLNLGLWQLSRLDQRKDRNAAVRERTAEPVADAQTLVDPGAYDEVGDLEFRQVTASGTYRADEEVIVRSRSRDGAPGSWVLTPLELDDGSAVVVNRGWIPNSGQLVAVPDSSRAPEGPVTVTGLVRESESRGNFGPSDPAEGTLTDLARADVERLDQQVDAELLPYYLQLQAQQPEVTAADPAPVPAPALDEGPHLSYAGQWFLFAAMTAGAYVLILRRRAREVEREASEALLDQPDPEDRPGPDDPRLDPRTTSGS